MDEFNQLEYQTVYFAALLHDIGKFHGRMEGERRPAHPAESGRYVSEKLPKVVGVEKWIDQSLLETLVMHHHERYENHPEFLVQNVKDAHEQALAYIVSCSDNCSSGERDDSEKSRHYYKLARLYSILSRVDIGRGKSEKTHYRELARLKPEFSFPDKIESRKDVQGLYRKLTAEFDEEIKKLAPTSFDRLFNGYLSLLGEFTWCVPSDTTTTYRDISLFDHLSTSSAIAACLYQYHRGKFVKEEIKDTKKAKFLLVGGDLSGIQNFLFEIGSTSPKRLSKTLRGRSFYLSLLTEIASYHILRSINLPLSCRIMSAAGRFILLLPHTDEAMSTCRSAVETIDTWMFEHFLGKLSLNIASNTLLSMEDLYRRRFGEKYRQMGQDVEDAKSGRYSGIISRCEADGHMRRAYEALSRDGEACEFCNVYPRAREGAARCRICEDSGKLGAQLVRNDAKYLYICEGSKTGLTDIFGYSVAFRDPEKGDEWLLMEKLDNTVEQHNPGYVKRYMSRHIPRKRNANIDLSVEKPVEGASLCRFCADRCSLHESVKDGEKIPARKDLVRSALTFQCLAASVLSKNDNRGVDHLAVLKADMDDTGIVFSQGFGENFSISRYSTLSRMVNYFFAGSLASRIEKDYRMAYIVYAGGDDLVLIAPWEDALNIAKVIAESFREYAGSNPNVTISMGISFMRPSSPVAWAVNRAEEFLERSKQGDKNSLTVFDTTVDCRELGPPYGFVDFLHKEYTDERSGVNSSFLYRMLKYQSMFMESENGGIRGLRFHSLMSRDIWRNIEKREKGQIVNPAVVDRLTSLCAVRKKFDSGAMKTLKIPVWWTLYKNRGGR